MPDSLFGPVVTPEGVTFRFWAPNLSAAPSLLLGDDAALKLQLAADGFFELSQPGIKAGQRYMFEVDGQKVPDPASRAQAGDAIGWSVVQPAASPRAQGIARRPWAETILCELHVGTVTPEGTYAALEAKLPYFRDAGYTAIELMPLADFTGRRGWGYDGVLPFAPDSAYGTPDELISLIHSAQALGLAIMLDVVYNHFGPSGNFLHLYAERFFSDKEPTPWGSAINLDDPTVRRFFVENACMWVGDYGFDGLRFDAVHAFMEGGGDKLLTEIAEAVRAISPGAYLALENDDNAARWLKRGDDLSPRYYSAQWNDDYHHVFHVLATGEKDGYYADYAENAPAAAARALTEGFVYQGEPSAHRNGKKRGEISRGLHPAAFVAFVQNHDQIGNRAYGDRLTAIADDRATALLRFLLLLSPQIPMFFMGEEFGAKTPFLFFCDFEGELGDAVREGRQKEFASFSNFGEGRVGEIPDPLAEETFLKSKIDWNAAHNSKAEAVLGRFKELAALRRKEIVPLLKTAFKEATSTLNEKALLCRWQFEDGAYSLALNLSKERGTLDIGDLGPADMSEGEIAMDGTRLNLGPWSGAFWGHR